MRATFTLLFFLAFWQMSCKDDTPMDMSPAQKRMVDTLYGRVTPDLRTELDSVCDTRFEIEMDALVDSLLEVRLKEKEALLNRQ